MPMVSCVACGQLTRSSCSCDHCGTKLKSCGTAQSVALAALGLLLTGCPPPILAQPEYGAVISDEDLDNDGHGSFSDCNDEDPDIYPGAPETAGDGIDSDCDGEDDPPDTGA